MGVFDCVCRFYALSCHIRDMWILREGGSRTGEVSVLRRGMGFRPELIVVGAGLPLVCSFRNVDPLVSVRRTRRQIERTADQ